MVQYEPDANNWKYQVHCVEQCLPPQMYLIREVNEWRFTAWIPEVQLITARLNTHFHVSGSL